MKLAEIKPISEEVTPIHVTMLLREVVKAEKVTNMAQYIVLAQLVSLFKLDTLKEKEKEHPLPFNLHSVSPRGINENPTSKQLYDDLRALDGDDQCKLARWLLVQLELTETIEDAQRYCNPQMGLAQWISWVSRAQE